MHVAPNFCSLTDKEIRAISESVLRDRAVGSVLVQGHFLGIPYHLMRGPMSLTAYIYVPGQGNEDDISVHGGVTFSEVLDSGTVLGWDYAHYNDGMIMPQIPGLRDPSSPIRLPITGMRDCKSAIEQFRESCSVTFGHFDLACKRFWSHGSYTTPVTIIPIDF